MKRHADERAELAAKSEGLARNLDAVMINDTVRDAVTRRGAVGAVAVGAAKLFQEEHRLIVETGDDGKPRVMVLNADETVTPVRDAVANWPEVVHFVPAKPVPKEAKFTRMVLGAAMRSKRHKPETSDAEAQRLFNVRERITV